MNFKNKVLEHIKQNSYVHISFSQLAKELELSTSFDLKTLKSTLDELIEDGEIFNKAKDLYATIEKSGQIKGILSANKRGFGFLRPQDQSINDIFIPPNSLNGAFNNDVVLVSIVSGDEGFVERIIERGNKTIVGTFKTFNDGGFVIPDDERFFNDIFVSSKNKGRAVNFSKVVVELTAYPLNKKNPEGKVIEVLGQNNAVGTDILSIIKTFNVPTEFSKEVMESAKKIPQEINQDSTMGREDFRNKVVFTIDGADAKDLDDAISIEINDKGNYVLGVHIADVSEYVLEDSALDLEAFTRGTSIYVPDRVVPMLPRELSNGICSLNEKVDRLTLSSVIEVDKSGKVVDSRIVKSVINSTKRCVYEDITKVIEGDSEEISKHKAILNEIYLCNELAKILIDKRNIAGSIDFETKECKIVLDKKGKVEDIVEYKRGIANRIIEEFMILANQTVGETMFFTNLPFLYRVHLKPEVEKLENFSSFIKALGINYKLNVTNIHSKNFQQILNSVKDTPLFNVVNKMMLRSMQKAKYSDICDIHFGLALSYYSHFTSPIRRYPDLICHRIIKYMIDGLLTEQKIAELDAKAEEAATHSSLTEKVADDIERAADDFKKAEFMIDKIGYGASGVVSGVTSFGVFVELPNTCEGLIRLESLPGGSYVYDDKHMSLSSGGYSFKLGDEVDIIVAAVDLKARKVEFVLDIED